jgi:hypothetical protein
MKENFDTSQLFLNIWVYHILKILISHIYV